MKGNAMRLLVLIPSMERGGAQRAVSLLTQAWSRDHDARVVTFAAAPEAYPHGGALACLEPTGGVWARAMRRVGVRRRIPALHAWLKSNAGDAVGTEAEFTELLGTRAGTPIESERDIEVFTLAHRALALQPILNEDAPDAVISFMESANLVAVVAGGLAGFRGRTIVSVRNNPRFIRPALRPLVAALYPKADEIVGNSEGIARSLRSEFGFPASKVRAVPNAVDFEMVRARSADELPAGTAAWMGEAPTFLAVGRLVPQKGYERLIDAFARVEARKPPRLLILGEGPERPALESTAARLGLADRVRMPGDLENPFPCYGRAVAFVMSSKYEGSPNVILESMACGCPVVSFDCDYGPAELIENERSGLLVREGDGNAMTDAMRRLLSDAEFRLRLSKGGIGRAASFSLDRIAPQWLEGVRPVTDSGGRRSPRS